MATDIAVVKKLEWFQSRAFGLDLWVADGYEISHSQEQGWWIRGGHPNLFTRENLEAAKAACQADFEQRILSVLSQDYLDLKASHDAAVGAMHKGLEANEAAAEYAKLIQVERFDRSDIAVHRAYERLRIAINAQRAAIAKATALIAPRPAAALTTPAAPVDVPPADDGWIAWAGGKCPVGAATMVDVKFRDLQVYSGSSAGGWGWSHEGKPHDIVAYRPAAGGAL